MRRTIEMKKKEDGKYSSQTGVDYAICHVFGVEDLVFNILSHLRNIYMSKRILKANMTKFFFPSRTARFTIEWKDAELPTLKQLLTLSGVSRIWNISLNRILLSYYNHTECFTLNDHLLGRFGDSITSLNLEKDENGITNEAFKRLSSLQTSLRVLNINYNTIIHGKSLQRVRNLKTLSLIGNKKITNDPISKLITLEKLILVNNVKIDASSVVKLSNLTSLSIGSNSYFDMDEFISSSRSSTSSFQVFDDKTLSSLSTNLRHLKIASCNKAYRYIERIISRSPPDKHTEIEENKEGLLQMRNFHQAFDNFIAEFAVRRFIDGIIKNNREREAEEEEEEEEDVEHHEIARFAFSMLNQPKDNTSTSNIIHSFTDKGLLSLKDTLQSLSITESKSFTDFSISQCTNLTNLSLKFNSVITDDALKSLSNLKKLCLSNNRVITDKGIIPLSSSLTELSLKSNRNISDDAVKLLTNLKTLNLCDNTLITWHGSVKYLMERIEKVLVDGSHPFLGKESDFDMKWTTGHHRKLFVLIK